MRALLVVNPKATTTTAAGRDVLAHALASELKLEVLLTRYRGHAAEATAQAVRDGVELVVAHGGDGTVNEVCNGMLQGTGGPVRPDPASGPALAVVPGGYADRLHRSGAVRGPVAGHVVIDVQAPEAVRAVIAVLRAGGRHRDVQPAVAAAEAVRAAMPGVGTAMG